MSAKSPFAGIRVELSPACDYWARGALFGTVRRFEVAGDGTPCAVVKLDHPSVKKLQRFPLRYITARTSAPWNPTTKLFVGCRVYLVNFLEGRVCATTSNEPNAAKVWFYPSDLEGGS